MAVLAIGYFGAAQLGVPLWLPWQSAQLRPADPGADDASRAAEAAGVKAAVERLADAEAKLAAEQKARAGAEARAEQLADAADKARRDQEAREKAARDEAARKKAEEDARVRAAAEADAERQRLAKAKADAEAALKAIEEAAQHIPKPGQTFRDCNDGCPEMVVVAAGRFKMGQGSSARDVTIQQAFAVGKFEVTFDEWAACVTGGGCMSNRSPSDRGWGKDRRPVINVSWNDAKEYVAWLSRKTGQTYRLLTEAEWEYAARAGTTTSYSWGDAIGKGNANCDGCGSQWLNKQTAPVGSFKPNDFGLHDMHGNVWEWCEDAYSSSSRVLRGGSWGLDPYLLRSAIRDSLVSPDFRNYDIGFRLARTL